MAANDENNSSLQSSRRHESSFSSAFSSDNHSCIEIMNESDKQRPSDNIEKFYEDLTEYLRTRKVPDDCSASVFHKQSLHYFVKDGQLFYGKRKPRLVITTKLKQDEILNNLHCDKSDSHIGVKQMQTLLQKTYFWRNCYSNIVDFVSRCKTCNKKNAKTADDTTAVEALEESETVWTQLQLCIYGPYPQTDRKNQFLFVLLDPVSRWLSCIPSKRRDSPETIAEFLTNAVVSYGLATICMLNGSEEIFLLLKEKYLSLLRKVDVDFSKTECIALKTGNSTSSEKLDCEVQQYVQQHPSDWDEQSNVLPWLWKMRTTNCNDGDSPFQQLFNRPFRPLESNKHEKSTKRKRLCGKLQNQSNIPTQQTAENNSGTGEACEPSSTETLAAVQEALAAEKDRRLKRGEYKRYTAEVREAMAKHALEKGVQDTIRVYSSSLGFPVNESSVRNFVKAYRAFSPQLKRDIGRCAAQRGIEAARSFYEERFGMKLSVARVRKFRRLYLGLHSQKKGEKKRATGLVRNVFCSSVRNEIGNYAARHGVQAAVHHFSDKLQCPVKESTVRKFRKNCVRTPPLEQSTLPPPPPPPPPPSATIPGVGNNYSLNYNPHSGTEHTFHNTYMQQYDYQQQTNSSYSSSNPGYHHLPPYPAYNLPPPPQYHEPAPSSHQQIAEQTEWPNSSVPTYGNPILQDPEPQQQLREELEEPEPSVKKARKKTVKKRATIRGRYSNYSVEMRKEIGQYASEHSTLETVEHFKGKGLEVPDSTVRFLRNRYLEMQEKGSDNSSSKGRPSFLGRHDSAVQECVRQLSQNGEKVTSLTVLTAAREIVQQREPQLLLENGGSLKLTTSWAKSFLKRITTTKNN